MHETRYNTPTQDCNVIVETTLWGMRKAKYIADGKYFNVMHGYHTYRFSKEKKFYGDETKNRVTGWEYIKNEEVECLKYF